MRRLSPWFVRGLGLWLLSVAPSAFAGAPSFADPFAMGPRALEAQNSCILADSRSWQIAARGTSAETHWFTDAVFQCDDGSRISSDSAIMSPPQRLSQLFGNVSFTEEGRQLTANRATYRTDIDRLDAFGDVVLVDSAGGSRIEGDNLVYLRAGEARPLYQLTVTGTPGQRPRATFVPRSLPPDTTVVRDSLSPDSAVVLDSLILDSASVAGADSAAAPQPPDPPAAGIPPDSLLADTVPADSARLPYTVVADRIVIVGEESFRGEGNAEVERGALKAYGNNMIYNEGEGELVMAGDARSEGEGYELSGQAITVVLPGDEVREIVARRQAALLTDDLDLTAPKIRIFVDQEALQRLVAGPLREDDGPAFAEAVSGPPAQQAGPEGAAASRGPDPNRAVATGESFTLMGDSLDIETPGEVLDRVHAIGNARAESYARDSINTAGTPEVALHDWIEGDTLVATFARRIVPDTAADSVTAVDPEAVDPGDPEGASAVGQRDLILDRLVATGSARSLYRMESNDSTTVGPKPLAIHYVLGTQITIEMREGEIDQMAVSGETRGFHFEPRTVAALSDTLPDAALGFDTLGTDTLSVDTMGVDTLRVDTLGTDTLGVDTLIVDTLRVDTLGRGSQGPERGGVDTPSSYGVEDARARTWWRGVARVDPAEAVRRRWAAAGNTIGTPLHLAPRTLAGRPT